MVSIPGVPDDNTLALIQSSAKLQFRPVIAASAGVSSVASASGSSTASPSPAASSSAPIATSAAKPTDGSDQNWVSSELQKAYEALDCTKTFRAPGQVDPDDQPMITCDTTRSEKYILGPVEVQGSDISNATASQVTNSQGSTTGEWAVNLNFNSVGTKQFGDVTHRLFPLTDPRNRFAVTLDGYVITAPRTNAVIANGSAQITGSFTATSSKSLADQLKYGSLPIGFTVQSQDNISATLGTAQLGSGLLAGAIGLLLVVVYSLFQYRALALITIGSLVVAAVATYLLIALLSWRQGYRLSLAGVTGLIVSIGITADSFIIYFERVRDSLREGKSLSAAVDEGWRRAIRTILVSDGISFLAASVLYLLTVGNVKGFAYTLGLTTLIDVAIVVLFTHPMLQLLAGRRFFNSGHKWSGFDIKTFAQVAYVGRGQFKIAETVGSGKAAKASKEAIKRQTIAERKSAAQNNQGEQN